jgi:hypothetical protein
MLPEAGDFWGIAAGAGVVAPSDADKIVADAFRSEQRGLFPEAIEAYRRALEAQPDHLLAAARLFRLLRDLRTDPLPPLTLVWQIRLERSWEMDWLRFLLSPLNVSEIVDGRHQEFHDGSIVVDNFITPSKRAYYFEMLKRRHRFALVHLSDERYIDDYGAYSLANVVIRNYWCRLHASDAKVLTVPLGLMNGFKVGLRKPARDRRYTWSFAGNVEKSSRAAMLGTLAAIGGGQVHCSGDQLLEGTVNPKPPLAIADYAQLMSETVFAPCPAGWQNLDSFRVCEALEAGCIPIVERRTSYDYFRHLFGDHPMMTVSDWSEAPAAIARLQADPDALESRRLACETWWQEHKRTTALSVQDAIRTRLAGF